LSFLEFYGDITLANLQYKLSKIPLGKKK
jgi:hypothetical protein